MESFAEESPKKVQGPVGDLEKLLRRLAKTVDSATVKALKGLVSGMRARRVHRRFISYLHDRQGAGRLHDCHDPVDNRAR
jgi:hypothetical protein